VITQLYIRNFAIIREVHIRFESGLTIITGETGAGKSILIGALSLLLGERADTQALMNPDEKCILEAHFDIRHLDRVKHYLREQEFDLSDELIIRRELVSNGKSRIFVNDTPATLAALVPLSGLLIDLHRQFDTIDLQQQSYQLGIIDDLANHAALLEKYRTLFRQWKNSIQQYEEVRSKNQLLKQEADYNRFLYEELEKLNLRDHELEDAESELAILNSAEELKSALNKAAYLLSESEHPLTAQLKQIQQSLDPFTEHSRDLKELQDRLLSLLIEAKDISSEVDALRDRTHFDEERCAQLNERLLQGQRLLNKHHVKTSAELMDIRRQLEDKLQQADVADEEEEKQKQIVEQLHQEVLKVSNELSAARQAQLEPVSTQLNTLLPVVGMPNAQIRLQHQRVEVGPSGSDRIDFLLDANRTDKFQPIAKAASGGELSRLMLCIKSLQAKSTQMPTLLFDEIDTGISGETAIQVAGMLKELSAHHQIICITHLPQIAGKGAHHLYIYKQENENKVLQTQVKQLSEQERIGVMAEMLGGKNQTPDAVQMIKQLMK